MSVLLYFIIMILFVVVFTLEVIAPASGAKCDKRWLRLAGLLNIVQVGATLAAGTLFHRLFSSYSIFSLPVDWSPLAVGLICFVTASFIAYWWHRALHRYDFLWRVFHQLHHSPARIEALTSFYLHPFDGMAATFISCLSSYFIFGASTEAVTWAVLLAAFYNLFIHMDKATPYWVGYVLARPEMHRVHHKRDYHANNYGLPVWDMLFGTWENPRERVRVCGFDREKEIKIGEMLRMVDIDA